MTLAHEYGIDAVMQGIKLDEYAEEYEELEVALAKCGAGRTGFQMWKTCRVPSLPLIPNETPQSSIAW